MKKERWNNQSVGETSAKGLLTCAIEKMETEALRVLGLEEILKKIQAMDDKTVMEKLPNIRALITERLGDA